jgi:hypothetical protein
VEPNEARQRFQAAREASRHRGELVWLRLAGSELERAGAESQAHAWLAALGLEGLAGLELGITTGEGTDPLAVRIEPRERAQARAASEPTAPSWSTLEVLPSDTLAVHGRRALAARDRAGPGRPSGSLGGRRRCGSILAKLDATPLFGRLGERGALADETLLFARARAGQASRSSTPRSRARRCSRRPSPACRAMASASSAWAKACSCANAGWSKAMRGCSSAARPMRRAPSSR